MEQKLLDEIAQSHSDERLARQWSSWCLSRKQVKEKVKAVVVQKKEIPFVSWI
jgi:hypothetical protein